MLSPRRVVVRLRPGSDGLATHAPNPGTHVQLDPPTLYLEKIADQWMQARGEAQPGVKYILESLPFGYTLWQRPRPKDPKHLDKYLYGHPDSKAFDSPNRFYPHFQHLMDNAGDRMGCPCTVCSGSSGVLPKSSSSSSKVRSSSNASSGVSSRPSSSKGSSRPSGPTLALLPTPTLPQPNPTPQPTIALIPGRIAQYKGRPKHLGVGEDTTRVDEEGTPDVYRNLIIKLRRHGELDETIEESLSLDWRAEQETFPDLLGKLKDSPQWVPRVGDIVLYVRELPNDVHIIRHPITGDFKMYDEATKLWLEHPNWEAGLIGQTPTESTTMEDICENGQKEGNVTYSGVRVEPLPDVNSTDKTLSKRYKYIPLRHTRPFVLWKQYLSQVSKWHPTILNAQAITSTLSLAGKYRFKGAWPEASVYCRGVYIGHEMMTVGDTVRLLPNASYGQMRCTDILVIKSIRLKWSGLDKASDNDWDDGQPYNSTVWIYGAAFTSDPTRTNKEWLSDVHSPKAADDYGEIYPLHPPTKELAVPYSRVLGRLYERDAMALWLNTRSNDLPLLDAGREGLIEARVYSRQHDQRIAHEPGATWYWGDSRAQALDLHTINGLDVAAHDPLRDPKEWRKKIKVMEGVVNNKSIPTAKLPGAPELAGRNLRGFMAPALSDIPVRSQISTMTDAASTDCSVAGSPTIGESSGTGTSRKRSHVVNLSSDEEEDDGETDEEIRQATRIIDDVPGVQTKKARIRVVID